MKKWYAIQTYAGSELKVKEELEKRVRDQGLEERFESFRANGEESYFLAPIEEVITSKSRRGRAAEYRIPYSYELSVESNNLRNQSCLTQTALRNVGGRNCLEVGGVWIDEGFDAKLPTVTVKCLSDAYFRILERHPQVKEVFRMGNHLVWVTPSSAALVIDTNDGKEKLTDEEIDKLFVAKK